MASRLPEGPAPPHQGLQEAGKQDLPQGHGVKSRAEESQEETGIGAQIRGQLGRACTEQTLAYDSPVTGKA